MRLRCTLLFTLLALGNWGCAASNRASPHRELWIPVNSQGHYDLEGRELWIDVELSGHTRQTLERYSDYEAQQDDPPPPPPQKSGDPK